ncbi:hypothetical protein PSV08DRAFT_243480 [Bipolaris maydis]|uniref:uncharacterized protein n=1 Tax=Cochliobolus heterostrophus TaxID=5016 RepID=UPI0024D77A2A|nr:hypothetical protein PSV08DRAFT_243480 [Bipolaris maydis]
MLCKTGTRLACACLLCTPGPHMPPLKSAVALDLHSLVYFNLPLYQWAHFGHGPSKCYLLQLCCLRPATVLPWLVRWLQNQHCVAGHQQPPRNIMHPSLPHVPCNATIKPLIIFNGKASSRSYVLDLYLQLHLLIPASRLPTHAKRPRRSRQAMRDAPIWPKDCGTRSHKYFAQSRHHPMPVQSG